MGWYDGIQTGGWSETDFVCVDSRLLRIIRTGVTLVILERFRTCFFGSEMMSWHGADTGVSR
jgi:hypothetical protein